MPCNLPIITRATPKLKTYKGEWFSINSVLGNDWAIFFALLGGRETGKSYSAMRWAVNRKLRFKDQCKFYWMRLTEAATKNLLSNGADKLVDPDLKRKFNLNLCTNGTTIYTYKEEQQEIKHKNGSISTKMTKKDKKEFCEVLACSTFYNTKGVGYFDNEYKGEYIIILDEMNREDSEANRFDIVYNFVNLIENIARSTKNKIKVIMIGNTLDEASDILTAFNFIPDDFGVFKLKKKRAVIMNILPNEEYRKRREGTIANLLLPEASTFTNELSIDRGLLVNKRICIAPQYIIKFSKSSDDWYTVWNGNVIKQYNNEQKPVVAMRKYLDSVYNNDSVNKVFEIFNSRAFYFTSLSCFKKFQKALRLLKK